MSARLAFAATVLFLTTVAAAALPAPSADVAPGSSAECARSAPLPPCNLWASRLPVGPANEIHVAVNPLDPQHLLVVGKDYGLGSNADCRPSGAYHVASASYVTFDGGQTWQVGRVPAPYPNGGAAPSPLRYKCGSDPVAIFGADGTAYYVLLNFQYTGGRQASIAVARSPDGGVTWPASDVRVLHTSSGDDKQWGAVDSAGRVHVVWYDGRIWYARSDTNYVFEAPRILANGGSGNPAVEVATGPQDQVYVTWRDGSSIKFTRSHDHGATFEPIRTAFTVNPYNGGTGGPRLPFMPHLAVDKSPTSPFSGRLYLTWPDTTGGDSNVFMASSGDGGLTWTAKKRVDDNVVAGKRQVMPTVSVAPNGRVDIAWQDERTEPPSMVGDLAGLGGTWTVYAAHSADAGATWSANRRVSEVPMVSAWSLHQDGSVFIGDYMGIASTDDHAWPAFPANGYARLAQGLPLDKFARVDATVAPLGLAGLAPAADAVGPPGEVASMLVPDHPAPPLFPELLD